MSRTRDDKLIKAIKLCGLIGPSAESLADYLGPGEPLESVRAGLQHLQKKGAVEQFDVEGDLGWRLTGELANCEQDQLIALEEDIQQGLNGFVVVGLRLDEIRSKRLYRGKYQSFHAYTEIQFGIEGRLAERWIRSARVVANIESSGTTNAKNISRQESNLLSPAVESHAYELRDLCPEDQVAAWQEVLENCDASGRVITTARVKEIAKRYLPLPPSPTAADFPADSLAIVCPNPDNEKAKGLKNSFAIVRGENDAGKLLVLLCGGQEIELEPSELKPADDRVSVKLPAHLVAKLIESESANLEVAIEQAISK